MRTAIEEQFDCTISAWNEPSDDLGGVQFRPIIAGRLVIADTLALLISALQEADHRPLMLMAA